MKILIIGLACSGKSTLARSIAVKTKLPLVHMDRLIWQENWVKTPIQEFLLLQEQALYQPNWIYEGFNLPSLQRQITAADTVVYLRKSHLHITINYLKRLHLYKRTARPDMPSGNAEQFSWSYIRWLWKYNNDEVLRKVYEYAIDKPVIVVSTDKQATALIDSLSAIK